MNDNTTNAIKNVRAKDKLANDAKVGERNRKRVGKRNNGSSLSPSGTSSTLTNTNTYTSSNQGLSSRNVYKNYTRKNVQNNSKALNMASKIPYIGKFAQMAQRMNQIKGKIQSKSAMIASLKNKDGDKEPSAEDIEAAKRAEEAGEEYKPDDSEKKYTAITGRQARILAVFIVGGAIAALAFLGVILMSALTDSGGEYYLASRDNPSEEDLEKIYNAQDGNSDSSGNVTASGKLKADGTFEPDNDKYDTVVELKSEPKPWTAINYWDNLDKDDFVYPKDKATGKYLGAWPKNYESIPTQLSGCKSYQKYFAWPTTPSNGTYNFVYNHLSMDIMADFGNPIYSPVDGKLVFSGWGDTHNTGSDETAYSITISPNNGVEFDGVNVNEVYMTHMSGIVNRCERGECNKTVKQGELLGFVGNAAGSATSEGYASHLHITLYSSGNYYGGLDTYSTEDFYEISSGTKRKVCE